MLKKYINKWNNIPIQVKASTSYTICSILQKCLSFITLPLFTRLLTTEQYGQYSVYTSWSAIFSIFITLNLAYGSFSTAMIKFEDRRYNYTASVQNICLLLALVFLTLYFPFRSFWNNLLQLPTALVLVMVAEILAQFAISCWYTIKQFEYKYKGVVAMTLVTAIMMPICAYLLVIGSNEKGYARIVGYALVSIVLGIVLFILHAVRGKSGINMKYWRYALSFNIPLIPYYLSQVIFNQSDRIMIDHICGTDKAGYYGVAYTLALMLNFVLNAINNSYIPWFYGKIKEGKEYENRSVANGISVLMSFLLLGVIALAPEIITVLAGKAYAEAIWVVPPVAISLLLLFYSQLFINVEFYYEEKTLLVWGSIGAAVLNILLNWLLIPIFGFIAAGYTTLVSYLAFAGTNYFTMRLLLRKRGITGNYFDLRALVIIFVAFVGLSFLAMALYKLPLIRYLIIIGILLALAINYKCVTNFVKKTIIR